MSAATRMLLAPLRPIADLLDLTGEAVVALRMIADDRLLRTPSSGAAPDGPPDAEDRPPEQVP